MPNPSELSLLLGARCKQSQPSLPKVAGGMAVYTGGLLFLLSQQLSTSKGFFQGSFHLERLLDSRKTIRVHNHTTSHLWEMRLCTAKA